MPSYELKYANCYGNPSGIHATLEFHQQRHLVASLKLSKNSATWWRNCKPEKLHTKNNNNNNNKVITRPAILAGKKK